VYFVTASEANRQRVLALILAEDEPMLDPFSQADKESPALTRGKPPMSEANQHRQPAAKCVAR
jgi:hypothetical protein